MRHARGEGAQRGQLFHPGHLPLLLARCLVEPPEAFGHGCELRTQGCNLVLVIEGEGGRRISVVQNLPSELPAALADGGQLSQVILNLILNACDAMPEGGVLTISGGTTGRRLWLEVADTGCGVPEELGERIFLPFVTSKPAGAGTGLGLAVSRAAIREMGGNLQLVTVPVGACFRIELELVS